MKVTTEKPEPGIAALTVEVPSEELDRALEQAWRRIAGRVNIPGFRRGKAPRPLVERHVGPAAINEEALRRLVPERYDAAVEETGIQPIERPSLDIVQLERGKPLVFRATVAVRPKVELGDYRSITVEPETVEVGEEQVNRVLEQLRESQAQWIPVEDRGLAMGDQAIADIKMEFPAAEGRPGRASDRQDTEVVLGHNSFPDGFDQALLGATPGETRRFTLSWQIGPGPGEPGGEAGKEPERRTADFTVTVKDLKRKQLPELDDAIAKSLGEHDTLEALTEDVRLRLRDEALRSARVALENKAADAAVEQATFEIPERLVEAETEVLVQERQRSLAQQRITLERYLQAIGKGQDEWRAGLREQALHQLKGRLALDEIAEKEEIDVTPEEVQEEIERTVARYGDQAVQARQSLSTDEARQRIAAGLSRQKAIERLVAYAGGYPAAEAPPASAETSSSGAAPEPPAEVSAGDASGR